MSGDASAEALIPGNPAHIQAAIDHAAAGVDPARNITTAWHQMRIPGWTGTAAQQWKTFTPREARHVGKAADAFRTVTQALTDYQTAFTTARAEAAAAILDAQAAERLTTDAKTVYRDAVRKAASAKPGTPDAKVSPYQDPGAVPLANAQTRLNNARTALLNAGNTAAATITTAATHVSHAQPGITGAGHVKKTTKPPGITDDGWDAFWKSPFVSSRALSRISPKLDATLSDFYKGFASAGWDTIVGLNDLVEAISPDQRIVRDIRNLLAKGPKGFLKQYQDDAETVIAVGSDPLGTLREMWRQVSAEDYWEGHPEEASGRVTFEVLSLLLPIAKLGTFGKAGRAASAAKNTFQKPPKPGLPPVNKGSGGKTGSGGGNKNNTKPPQKDKKTVDDSKTKGDSATIPNPTETSKRISEGHAYEKHVIKKEEFPGISTREQFAKLIEDVIKNGEGRVLKNGRNAFWKDGAVVITDPKHLDGGTTFRPIDGYQYFLDMN